MLAVKFTKKYCNETVKDDFHLAIYGVVRRALYH